MCLIIQWFFVGFFCVLFLIYLILEGCYYTEWNTEPGMCLKGLSKGLRVQNPGCPRRRSPNSPIHCLQCGWGLRRGGVPASLMLAATPTPGECSFFQESLPSGDLKGSRFGTQILSCMVTGASKVLSLTLKSLRPAGWGDADGPVLQLFFSKEAREDPVQGRWASGDQRKRPCSNLTPTRLI